MIPASTSARSTGEQHVGVGQVWQDNDPRGGAKFVILGFSADWLHVWVENVSGTPRRRKVKMARLRPGKRGYSLVEEAPWLASMTARQRYALTHPLNNARDPSYLAKLRSVRQRGDGSLVVVILAIDR